MKKFIIIEGLDRVGKDTAVKKIVREFNKDNMHAVHYFHTGHSTVQQQIMYNTRLYKDMFNMMLEGHDRSYIFNRSHLSESVYADLYRGYSGDYVFDIEREFSQYLPIWDKLSLVVLSASPETILSRGDDGDTITNGDRYGEIKKETDMFKLAFDKTMIRNKAWITTDNLTPDDVHSYIVNFLKDTYEKE
jgi:thymidylate kinase